MDDTDNNCFKYVRLIFYCTVNELLWNLTITFIFLFFLKQTSNPRLDISKLPFFWHSSNIIVKAIEIIVSHLSYLVELTILNVSEFKGLKGNTQIWTKKIIIY